jgi:hypothetical protein
MYREIVVCEKCGFTLPEIMGYVGQIHCWCGKVVFDNLIYTDCINHSHNITCISH